MDGMKRQILDMVRAYAERGHTFKPFSEGDSIHYAGRVYDAHEVVNLVDSALEFWLTAGKYTEAFERKFADYIGVNDCLLVNSGSSANLLAFMALTSPLLDQRAIGREDEVITVAAGFPTTVAPIVQYGAVPVFVDITIPQYNIDISLLESALSNRTKAVFLAHTLGNPFDVASVKSFCAQHGLWLIEDNCDALGSEYALNGKKHKTGTFGDVATSSFYPPHHMTTGEGGAVYTSNSVLAKILRSMRDWGRDCACAPGQDNCCQQRFDGQFGALPPGYDHKYIYSHFGFNMKATDLQAAIGVAQLEKMEGFVARRRENFNVLLKSLQHLDDRFILPEPCRNSNPSWFGFPITCRRSADRNEIVRRLESRGIQTRMLFAGNILRQPCFDRMRESGEGYRVVGTLQNTDRVMNGTFWLGVYPSLTREMLDYMTNCIGEATEDLR